MEALLYFGLWAGLIFLMMRFGCGPHAAGQGQAPHGGRGEEARTDRGPLRWVAPETDADPVCGKRVGTDNAKPSVHDGTVFYFCSRECRERFEAAPDLYLGGGTANHLKLEHSHV